MIRSQVLWIAVLGGSFATAAMVAAAQEAGANRSTAGRPATAQAAPPRAPVPDPAQMQQLLRDWEAQSAKLKTLEVSIYRIDKLADWDDEEHYTGSAAFEAPQLAHLDFRKVKMQTQADPKNKDKKRVVPVRNKDNQIVSTPHETIVATAKNEVWHYRYEVKQVLIYPLNKDQRKRAIEEGPLPFLFNMRVAEANARYQMTLRGEDEKSYLVKIVPLLKEDQDSFCTAWIYLDRKFLLPTRIFLVSPDQKSSKDFRLWNIKANAKEGVDPQKFVGVVPPKWKVERNPAGDPKAAQHRHAALRLDKPGPWSFVLSPWRRCHAHRRCTLCPWSLTRRTVAQRPSGSAVRRGASPLRPCVGRGRIETNDQRPTTRDQGRRTKDHPDV